MQPLFTLMAWRDILKRLLMMESPSIFGTIARLNRHCNKITRSLKHQKQRQYLIAVQSTDPAGRWVNWRFSHNGHYHGEYKEWDPITSQLITHCYHDNGKLHGRMMAWYSDGTKWIQCTYRHDEFHGRYREWYKNGRLHFDHYYKHDVEHGRHISWYENGRLRMIIDYRYGIRNGILLHRYPNGRIAAIYHYEIGLRHGKCIRWRKNGKLIHRYVYRDGKRHGRCVEYNDGEYRELIYEKDELVGPAESS